LKSRYEESGASARKNRTDCSSGNGSGYSQKILQKGIGLNCTQAEPDDREMIELLVAQAASQQEQSSHDISRRKCAKCKEE